METAHGQEFGPSCTEAIAAAYEGMSKTEKRIADFLLEQGAACCSLSARELAEACGCSPASVVRFARRLRFDGLSELKYQLRRSGQVAGDDIMLSSSDPLQAMKQKALQYSLLSLRTTVEGVDSALLDAAADAVRKARRVVFCAMGSAAGAALSACSQLLSFGIPAVFYQDELLQLRTAACLGEGDVLIGINYHNAASGVADAFDAARKRGAVILLITAVREGLLSRYADFTFYTPLRKDSNSLNISASFICQSMLLQLLILRIWQLAPEQMSAESARLRPLTREKLK